MGVTKLLILDSVAHGSSPCDINDFTSNEKNPKIFPPLFRESFRDPIWKWWPLLVQSKFYTFKAKKKNHSHGFTSLFQSFLILFHLVINLFTYYFGCCHNIYRKNGMNWSFFEFQSLISGLGFFKPGIEVLKYATKIKASNLGSVIYTT